MEFSVTVSFLRPLRRHTQNCAARTTASFISFVRNNFCKHCWCVWYMNNMAQTMIKEHDGVQQYQWHYYSSLSNAYVCGIRYLARLEPPQFAKFLTQMQVWWHERKKLFLLCVVCLLFRYYYSHSVFVIIIYFVMNGTALWLLLLHILQRVWSLDPISFLS